MSEFFKTAKCHEYLLNGCFDPMLFNFTTAMFCINNLAESLSSRKFLNENDINDLIVFDTINNLSGLSKLTCVETFSKTIVKDMKLYPSGVTLTCEYYNDVIIIIISTHVRFTLILNKFACDNIIKCSELIKSFLTDRSSYTGTYTPNNATIFNILKMTVILDFLRSVKTDVTRNYLT